MRGGRITPIQYRVPAAVLVLGVLSTGMVFWTYRISERQRVNFLHVDAVTDLQVITATFHLRFEEALAEGGGKDAEKTLAILEGADMLSQALLHGGKTEHGTLLPPLDNPLFRQQAEGIAGLLAQMRMLASERIANPDTTVGSPLEKRFDAIFQGIQTAARDLELVAEETQAHDHVRTSRLLLAIVLVWLSGVAASTWGLLSIESRRRRAELALEDAYAGMERRVLARTAELADANIRLREEIAERERADLSLRMSEAELRRVSAQFQTLLDTIPDSIILVSRDLKVMWANRGAAAVSLSGHAGGYCYQRWHNRSSPCGDCPARKSYLSGKAESGRITSPDGRHWEIRAVPVIKANGAIEGVIEVASDVTDSVTLQAETMRAAHLASIGELAAGVAHEINSPINGIINYAQILFNKSAPDSREHDVAGRILKEGDRIADIVRGLLSFARDRKEEKRSAAIGEILGEALLLTESQMRKEGILLAGSLAADLPEVVANPQQIQQVLMNLISNARYALNQKYPGPHEDKVLEIRGERIVVDGAPRVRLVFRDRGSGIPAGLVDKAIEPFFSTKPAGEGTGLGLSICNGIVSDHGGRLTIESVEGEFTEVTIDLPARGEGDGQGPRDR